MPAGNTWYLERALAIGDDPRLEVERLQAVDANSLRDAGVVKNFLKVCWITDRARLVCGLLGKNADAKRKQP